MHPLFKVKGSVTIYQLILVRKCMKIEGIIFDMDGTMVDNMMTHHRAWQRKLADLGMEMPLDEVKATIHGINEEILERLFGDRFTPAERKQISSEKEATYREVFLPDLKLIEGLPAFLEEVSAAGIPMSIGTAAPIENVDFVLDALRLRHYFKSVVHAGMVSKGKPHPEVLEKAAAGMGVALEHCIVFEDSVTGAEAASRAGCPVFIITTTHAPEEFARFSHVMGFFDDFQNITLDKISAIMQLNISGD